MVSVDKSIFSNGNDGYKVPIAFKLIPAGDNRLESLKTIFHFLYDKV